MRRVVLVVLALLILVIFNACSILKPGGEPSFIKVNGTHLEQDGKLYYFTGANMWYGSYIASSGKTGDRERLKRELDNLKSIGITNLRILGASEEINIENSLNSSFQNKPGVYNDTLLDGLDFLLAEMGKRGMYAVIFINNYWNWSGGMSQYKDWADGGGGVDSLNKYKGEFLDYAAAFYGDAKANGLFRNYLHYLINRKNNYTGNYYYEDPAIMAWQLANEPRPGRDRKFLEEYYSWIDSTAKYIHTIDKNHLVTTGSEGLEGTLRDSAIYFKTHQFKSIDYMTIHLWAKNWGWFDAKNADKTYEQTEKKAVEYINKHIIYAREMDKPIVMEEFGLPRDSEFCTAGTRTTVRDRYYKKIFGLIYDSASTGAAIAGTNFWGWGGEGRPQRPDGKHQTGDPFVGDPFGEPQGLNSVFDADTSTIGIIKNNANLMNSLDKKIIKKDDKDELTK